MNMLINDRPNFDWLLKFWLIVAVMFSFISIDIKLIQLKHHTWNSHGFVWISYIIILQRKFVCRRFKSFISYVWENGKKDEMYYFFFSSFQCHIFLNDSKQLSTYILSPYRTYGCISLKRATIWKTKCSNRSQPRPAVCDISKSGSDEEIQALCPAACIYVLMSRRFVSRVSNPLFYPLFSYLPPSLDPSHVPPCSSFSCKNRAVPPGERTVSARRKEAENLGLFFGSLWGLDT